MILQVGPSLNNDKRYVCHIHHCTDYWRGDIGNEVEVYVIESIGYFRDKDENNGPLRDKPLIGVTGEMNNVHYVRGTI